MRIIKCPLCNVEMKVLILKGVEIDKCPECSGIWLDKGEMQQLASKERIEARKAIRSGKIEPEMIMELLAKNYG